MECYAYYLINKKEEAIMNGPIKGAFLQIPNPNAAMPGAGWKEAIDAMNRLQMELITGLFNSKKSRRNQTGDLDPYSS
ncbi:MAG: hypothetical protein D3908_12030 [Candidatus Electrothrix sp. AUS4]|nr:hypothetical protein [Candidatus Electrothrix sp. AUS4]